MAHTVNLDNYFARIGYDGPRAATLEVLQALHGLQPRAIPFENLNPLTRRAVPLDLESVERKLVTERRGGYCFEQNALFADVLRQLGFTITPLLGRVLWGREAARFRRARIWSCGSTSRTKRGSPTSASAA